MSPALKCLLAPIFQQALLIYNGAGNENNIILTLTASGLFSRRAIRGDPSSTHTAVTFIHPSANANAESDGGSRLLAAVLHLSAT